MPLYPNDKDDTQANPSFDVNEEWVFLMNAKDEIEADSIEALLSSCEVPVLRAHNDSSTLANVYTGKSNFGADLLVPASRLEEAKGILNSSVDAELEDLLEAGEEEQEFKLEELGDVVDESGERVIYHKNRRAVAWLLLAIIGLLALIGYVLGPSGILNRLMGK